MASALDPLDPIPNLPRCPQPVETGDLNLDSYRRANEQLMAELARWPRVGYGFFNQAPTVNDDDSFGYERGYLWVADVEDVIVDG